MSEISILPNIDMKRVNNRDTCQTSEKLRQSFQTSFKMQWHFVHSKIAYIEQQIYLIPGRYKCRKSRL